MKLFLDFDGTLIDSRDRLYRLFQNLVPQSTFTFQEYWDVKRRGISHEQLLAQNFKYSNQAILNFKEEWLARIELPEWLILDKPFEGVADHLKTLKQSNKLFLITARQHQQPVLNQLSAFGWSDFFTDIFVTQQTVDKKTMIERAIKVNSEDWLIGDTAVDIQTGKLLGIHTGAVLTGFLSRETLSRYEPDLFLDTILDFNR